MGSTALSLEQIDKIAMVYDGQTSTIDKLVAEFNCPRYRILQAAAKAGKTVKKPKRWTPEEKRYLIDNWGRIPIEDICAHLGRTETGIILMKRRLGLSTWDLAKDIGYSVSDLEGLTGIDHRYWHRFIGNGELKAVRLVVRRGETAATVSRVDEIKAFIKNRPEFFDYINSNQRTKKALELDAIPPAPKFKLLTCRSGNFDQENVKVLVGKPYHGEVKLRDGKHQCDITSCAEQPHDFWAPIYEHHPQCPRCGSVVSRFSEKQRYRDEPPDKSDDIAMLAAKLGLTMRDNKIVDPDTGEQVSDEQLLYYVFHTKRNPRRAFKVFAKLLRAGLVPAKNRPVARESLARNIMDYRLTRQQQTAWNRFLFTSQLSVLWAPGIGKMYFAGYAFVRIPGVHLLFVNTKLLREQWVNFFTAHAPNVKVRTNYKPFYVEVIIYQRNGSERSRVKIFSYRTRYHFNNSHYGLVVYDEMQFLPGNLSHRLAMVKSNYRLGLTATAYREDGREELLELMTGEGIGSDWQTALVEKNQPIAPIRVIVVNDVEAKFRITPRLVNKKARTIIFTDRIKDGKQLSTVLNLPFVHGQTKENGQAIISNHLAVILSRVGDQGLDIEDLEWVVEFSFHYGSRQQELQRYGRLLHSNNPMGHIVLMTRLEFSKYSKRLTALEDKGFKIHIETWAGSD